MPASRSTTPQDSAMEYSANLFASRSADQKTIVIGGQSPDERQWAYTLTRRAAQALWFDLTRVLFPEKSGQVLGQVSTMPSLPPVGADTDVTSAVFVKQLPEGGCQLDGWVAGPAWRVRMDAVQLYRFWAALDSALYPTGWG